MGRHHFPTSDLFRKFLNAETSIPWRLRLPGDHHQSSFSRKLVASQLIQNVLSAQIWSVASRTPKRSARPEARRLDNREEWTDIVAKRGLGGDLRKCIPPSHTIRRKRRCSDTANDVSWRQADVAERFIFAGRTVASSGESNCKPPDKPTFLSVTGAHAVTK